MPFTRKCYTPTRYLQDLLSLFSCVMYGAFCSLKTLLELSNVHKRNRNWFWSCSHGENGLLRKSSRPQPVKRWFFQLLIMGRKKKSNSMIPNESSGSETSRIRLWSWQSNSGIFFLGFPVFSTTMEHSFSVTITFKWLHHSESWQTNVKVKRKKHKLWKTIKKIVN